MKITPHIIPTVTKVANIPPENLVMLDTKIGLINCPKKKALVQKPMPRPRYWTGNKFKAQATKTAMVIPQPSC